MSGFCRSAILSFLFFSSIVLSGCGGGGGGANPVATSSTNTAATISGSVVLPSGTTDISSITANLKTVVLANSFDLLEAHLVNLKGESIATPAPIDANGNFTLTNVPTGTKYCVSIKSKSNPGKCLLQAFIDNFDGTTPPNLVVNHSSTAVAILVAMNGFKNTAASVQATALSDSNTSNLINQISSRVSGIIKGTISLNSSEDPIANAMGAVDNSTLQLVNTALGGTNSSGNSAIELPTNLDGKFIETGKSLSIEASCSANIAKVIFFKGSEKLGEDTSAPFTYSWTQPPTGAWVITARAIASDGSIGFSNRVKLNVGSLVLARDEVRFASPVSTSGNELNTLSMQIRILNVPDTFDVHTMIKCLPAPGSDRKWKRSQYVSISNGIALVFVDGISFATVMEFDRLQFSGKLPVGAIVEIYNKDKSTVVASSTVTL